MTARISRRRLVAAIALLATGSVLAGVSEPAASAAVRAQQVASQNWSGYLAKGRKFSSVSASWVVPSAGRSVPGYSAFWVGLGGSSHRSPGLEQVGTDSDYVNGRARYYAWYEVLPAPATPVGLSISPGDRIAAKVTVSGTTTTMTLRDLTTGRSMTRRVHTSHPDTSSAEWIAEAPSTGSRSGGYRILPLSDFGTVGFTNARAVAGGRAASITGGHWKVQRIQLVPTSTRFIGVERYFPGGVAIVLIPLPPSGGALTSAPMAGGSSFTVSWRPGAV